MGFAAVGGGEGLGAAGIEAEEFDRLAGTNFLFQTTWRGRGGDTVRNNEIFALNQTQLYGSQKKSFCERIDLSSEDLGLGLRGRNRGFGVNWVRAFA
jgi:hypothetical protein